MEDLSRQMVLVIMGVSGSGKTTIASILAGRLGWPLQEGDALHPPSNIEKMSSGRALTDADRVQWLEGVAGWVGERIDSGENGVITCSALKRSYRDRVNRRGSGLVFVFLAGSKETIAPRLAARQGHFMPPSLLDSQLAGLEDPQPDEPHVRVDVSRAPTEIAQEILLELSRGEGGRFQTAQPPGA